MTIDLLSFIIGAFTILLIHIIVDTIVEYYFSEEKQKWKLDIALMTERNFKDIIHTTKTLENKKRFLSNYSAQVADSGNTTINVFAHVENQIHTRMEYYSTKRHVRYVMVGYPLR